MPRNKTVNCRIEKNMFIYRLKKIVCCMLKELDQIEMGNGRLSAVSLARARLLQLQEKATFSPAIGDQLESLTNILVEDCQGNNQSLEWMRILLNKILQISNADCLNFITPDHQVQKPEELIKCATYESQRMRSASLVFDVKRMIREHQPTRRNWEVTWRHQNFM